jgi:hypothetical protein
VAAMTRVSKKRLEICCWPVGQGLFGHMEVRAAEAAFRIVYDCGGLGSDPDHVQNKVRDLEAHRVDLLVLSHFHLDHISGVPALVNSKQVGRAWIPYLAPQVRVVFATALAAQATLAGLLPANYVEPLRLVGNPRGWFGARGVPVDELGGPAAPGEAGPPRPPRPPRERPPDGPRGDAPDAGRGLSLGQWAPWPEAFRDGSATRAARAELGTGGPTAELVLTLATWVTPLQQRVLQILASETRHILGAKAGPLFQGLFEAGAPEISHAEVKRLAETVQQHVSRRALQVLYRRLQRDLNATSLFLLARGVQRKRSLSLWTRCQWPWVMRRHSLPGTMAASGPCSPAALWTGDAPSAVLMGMLADVGCGLAALLKSPAVWQVPHHGSHESFAPRFYEFLSPCGAFLSCGRDNRYGHPSAQVVRHTSPLVITEDCRPMAAGMTWDW